MSTAIRLINMAVGGGDKQTLARAESHGKRLDDTSQMRKVRDSKPLTWPADAADALDLVARYSVHSKGVRTNALNTKPVTHAIIQYPVDASRHLTEQDRRKMLDDAVAFIQTRYGGNAVFAARMDTDEQGEYVVDVFFSAIYEKTTKAGITRWSSSSKFQKAICEKHRDEIIRRNKHGKFVTNTRAQGRAMQSEWRAYMTNDLGFCLPPKHEKSVSTPDRLSPETYGAIQDAKRDLAAVQDALDAAQADLKEVHAQCLQARADTAVERLAASMVVESATERLIEAQDAYNLMVDYCVANGMNVNDLNRPDDADDLYEPMAPR